MSVSKELIDVIKGNDNKGTKPYDTAATVTRVDGSTVWVHIPGGVDETPVKRTVDAKQGDVVQVRVSGGSAWLNGNASAPPTDDTTAKLATEYAKTASIAADSAVKSANEASEAASDAKATANSVRGIAEQAQEDANTAKASAENASEYAARALGNLSTVQSVTETLNWITQHGTMALTTDVALDPTHVYFVVDPLGDYEVGGTHYSVVTEPDVDDIGTYYELSIDESLNNYVGTHLAVTSEGLWLLPTSTGTNKILIATGAGSVYTTAGTYIIDSDGTTVLASFRADGTTIGENANGEARSETIPGGMKIIRKTSGGTDISIAVLGYGDSNTSSGTSENPYYSFGTRVTTATNNYDSTATYNIGDRVLYNDVPYVCKRKITTPEAWDSNHWQLLIGDYSVAEGRDIISSGPRSHGEGMGVIALKEASHAEGMRTQAIGGQSHSEGAYTVASGERSHSQNIGTVADSNDQTALGKYNIKDSSGTYAVIIGNGTADNARSNALTVGWDGVVKCSDVVASSLVGEVKQYAGLTVPTGWLECDGSEVAIADYPLLYNAIGTLWGTPTDSDHFKLPNFKGRVPVGYDSSDTAFDTVGETGGSKYIQAHTHSVSTQPTFTIPNHKHSMGKIWSDGTGTSQAYQMSNNRTLSTRYTNQNSADGGGGACTRTANVAIGAVSGATTGSSGNLQPYAVVKYIICAV